MSGASPFRYARQPPLAFSDLQGQASMLRPTHRPLVALLRKESERAVICRHPPTRKRTDERTDFRLRLYHTTPTRGRADYSRRARRHTVRLRHDAAVITSKPEQPTAQGERGSGDSLDKPAANSLSAAPTPPVRSLFRLGLHSLCRPVSSTCRNAGTTPCAP